MAFGGSLAHFPVVVQAIMGTCGLVDVDGLARLSAAAHARGQRFAIISDTRAASVPDAATRRALADLAARFRGEQHHLIANILILDSAILAGALTAVRWFIDPDNMPRVVRSARDAVDVIGPLFAREGLTVAPGPRALLESMDAQHARGQWPLPQDGPTG